MGTRARLLPAHLSGLQRHTEPASVAVGGPGGIMLRRVLITLDAVGGVWRYAMDVAHGLQARDVDCLLIGFGPEPDAAQRAELGREELVWTHEPLDWMVAEDAALGRG